MGNHVKNPTQYNPQEIQNEGFNDSYKMPIRGMYGYTGITDAFAPMPIPLLDSSFDYIGFSNADANGNYQTWTFKKNGVSGTTVRTLSVTYDALSKITSITRS